MSALESAVSLYSRARELWPEDDPDYPRLLFELGEALAWARNGGAPELEEAARLLLGAGYVEDAAVAEALAGNAHWVSGRQEVASVHYDRALELIVDLPETRATAQIRALTWRAQLLANENPSLAEGLRILALTEEVGTTESILNARITVGIGHAHFGDPQASIVALELALEQCLLANSHLAARAILNLASVLGTVGELERSATLHREGVELSRRFGSLHEWWLVAECAVDDYIFGEWDSAIEGASSFLDGADASQYMEVGARYVLAATCAARGDRVGANEHARIGLVRAREIGDPQVLWGSLGGSAVLAVDAGETERAQALVGELAAAFSAADSFQIEPSQVDCFVAAAALGRAGELGAHLGKVAYDSPWVEACRHIVEGRLNDAGALLDARKARTYAAAVRLLEAELAGRETPGLGAAVSFFESVGASACLSRGAALLQNVG